MTGIESTQDIANCKLQIANCKLEEPLVGPRSGRSFHFAICSLLLLFLCGIFFFHRLADRDLWNSHEGRAAQDAQSLLNQGDWAMPRLFDGEPEMQKPPLYYWVVAAIAWVRNAPVDAWAVRLPAAIAATVCVLGMFLWGRGRGRIVMGLVAAMVLATAMHFTWLARVGRIDMPLTMCVCLALFGYFGDQRLESIASCNRFLILALAYVAIAVGFLFKGPIALALPAAVIAFHLAIERELPLPWQYRRWLRLIHRLGLWWGLPLVAALVLPWFLWANATTQGEWFRTFFWRHNVERGFLGDGENHWNHPWWAYGPLFVWDFLPWSVLVLPAVWFLFHKGWWRADPEARFGLTWLVAMMAVLSCMHFKRSDYLLPAYPGAAILLGCVAERCYQRLVATRGVMARRIAVAGFGAIVIGCLAGWLIYVDWDIPRKEATREYRQFARQIREFAPPAQPVLFFRTDRHALVFHVGQPVMVFVEWEKLDDWAARLEPGYVVMPAQVAREWPLHLKSGRLEEVARNTPADGQDHERPLVLLRTRSNTRVHDP